MADFDEARALALALPGAQEGTAYGTPAFRVGKKLFARLREPDVLVARVEIAERDILTQALPAACFVTPHYQDYPYVLVRLSAIARDDLADLLDDAWRLVAPKRFVAAREAGG